MTAKQKKDPGDVVAWYLGFMAHFSDCIEDHKEDEDQRNTVRQLAKYCDDWEEMSPHRSGKIQAQSALDMFSECITMSKGSMSDQDPTGHLAERCSSLFIDRVRMLNKNEKEMFAYRVATMYDGHFGSRMFEGMLTVLVGPTNVGDVLDTVRKDLFYRFRDSDDIVMEAVDCQYREFAERLIDAAGRSSKGRLKTKLTIRTR